MAGQPGLFNLQDRYAELSKSCDPLERLLPVVDFEVFRPPLDAVMMFKILVLQALYGLSEEQAGYKLRDRLRFLGLELGDRLPDRTTIWLFREALVTAEAMEGLFARFNTELKERDYYALGGQIIDASVVEALWERLTREERRQIRDDEAPWPPAKVRQKDTQARWTVRVPIKTSFYMRKINGLAPQRLSFDPHSKTGTSQGEAGADAGARQGGDATGGRLLIPAFSDKSHITIDRRLRLIRRFIITDAARHDGAQLPSLLNPDAFDSRVWSDGAYRSKANEAAIAAADRRRMVHVRKPKGWPMPEPHQSASRVRSAVRSTVEHVFADQKARMALFIRILGPGRATVKIDLANLAYNFRRLIWLEGRTAPVQRQNRCILPPFSAKIQSSPKKTPLPHRCGLSIGPR